MAFGKKDKNDFYGKEITDAIKSACEKLGVTQDQLEIDIISAGSVGIFGLIRKKAHIRAFLKPQQTEETVAEVQRPLFTKKERPVQAASSAPTAPTPPTSQERVAPVVVSAESIALVEKETLKLLELMKFPATISSTTEGGTINCVIQADGEAELTSQDGKILDSLQYLVRKIVVKRVEERLRINLDVNGFRNRRLNELKVRAVELAELVKQDGKTQVLTSLNPSERRVIHIILQEDKEIRSRSVGDGLFKKILIYKPDKGNRNNRNRHNGNDNRGKGTKPSNAA